LLLVVSLFLHEQQQFSLSNKLHDIANTIDSVTHAPIALVSCRSPLISFIQENLTQCPTSSFPFPPTPAPDDMPSDFHMISSMVDNIFNVASHFLPNGNPKALLSSHGLHIFFKMISSICPPTISPYEFNPFLNQRPFPSTYIEKNTQSFHPVCTVTSSTPTLSSIFKSPPTSGNFHNSVHGLLRP
jgi:hypothetical protein